LGADAPSGPDAPLGATAVAFGGAQELTPAAAAEVPAEPVVIMPASPEALLFAVVLGALSAYLLVLACRFQSGEVFTSLPTAALFVGGWITATWFLVHDTGRVLVVLRQGFGLGALQWAILAVQRAGEDPAFALSHPVVVVDAIDGALAGGFATVMVWTCLAGFAFCWIWTRSPYRELGSDRI
jgi:hypothetical protein